MKAKILFLIGIGLLILAMCSVSAQTDMVVIDSADGKDVYSGIVYANTIDADFRFLVSTAKKNAFTASLDRTNKNVYLIESKDNAYVINYKSALEDANFSVSLDVSESGDATNLALARKSPAKKFIVIDDTYGYNAISVVPYASITKSYVLFADKERVDDVYSFLKERNPEDVLIYGYVDSEVKDKLKEFNLEILDKEDRFDNNIEIVKKYREINPKEQVILTDGTFLELGMLTGDDPIVLLGADVVPNQVADYIKDTDIRVGVLVGNLLTQPAGYLRDTLRDKYGKNFSVIVRFGKGMPGISGTIETLDMLPLPVFPLKLYVVDANYNDLTKKLEVTYKNNATTFAYFKPTITVNVGGERKTMGDEEPVFIAEGESMGREYGLDLSAYDVREANVTAKTYVEYGESPRSLEKVVEKEFLIAVISKEDTSALDVESLAYDPDAKQIVLTIKNTGGVKVYFRTQFNLNLAGGARTFKKDEIESLNAGGSIGMMFSGIELSKEDIEANKAVKVLINFGDREAFLTKTLEKKVTLQLPEKAQKDNTLLIVIGLTIIIIIILLFLFYKKGKK